jgi:hypothetical protein
MSTTSDLGASSRWPLISAKTAATVVGRMFSTRGQPTAVIERYGDTGQYVTGDHIEGYGDYRTIEYWVGVSR